MSLAPQNEPNDLTDVLNGSLTSWYESIDTALRASECVPGYYEYAQNPSYGQNCPVQLDGSTKIDIKCARFNVASLDNSYIDVVFNVPIHIPAIYTAQLLDVDDDGNTFPSTFYVGFKSAYDIVEQYRVYSNGDLVFTQNNANYESFLDYITLTDQAKENSECYATSKKIQEQKTNVPGTYITISSKASQEIDTTITLKFKLPINKFMMLRNLKWFPGFMGTLTLEIFPSYRNMIWCQIDKFGDLSFIAERDLATSINDGAFNGGAGNTPSTLQTWENQYLVGTRCQQINSPLRFLRIDTADGDAALDLANFSITASTCTLTKFHYYQAYYMLKMDVYNSLEYNYLQAPLLFPIQSVDIVRFATNPGTLDHFTLQNTATLNHCDTVFVVFPYDVNSRTCFTNPEITWQLNLNGKYYPRERYSTIGDNRFINLTLDALNINNNPLVSVGDDIMASLQVYKRGTKYYLLTGTKIQNYTPYFDKDISNFFLAVPLCSDEDFMGGISSNGATVQIELLAERTSNNQNINQFDWTQAPVAIFLQDQIMKIYSMKPAGRKQIDITNATLEQIAAGA